MAWWHGATDDSEEQNIRAHTRKDQKGWIASLDNGHARKVTCEWGRCVVEGEYPNGMVEIQTDTELLRVPHGRLDFSPAAALTNLSTDLKREGEAAIGKSQAAMAEEMARVMKRHQAEIDKISRTLLLDLVAVEQAKHAKYPEPKRERIGHQPPKIERTAKRIEGPKNAGEAR